MSVRIETTQTESVVMSDAGVYHRWLCKVCDEKGFLTDSKTIAELQRETHKRSNRHKRNIGSH